MTIGRLSRSRSDRPVDCAPQRAVAVAVAAYVAHQPPATAGETRSTSVTLLHIAGLVRVAVDAGFASVEVLPTDHETTPVLPAAVPARDRVHMRWADEQAAAERQHGFAWSLSGVGVRRLERREDEMMPAIALADAVVDALFAEHPDMRVAALSADGLVVPVPASVPVTTHRVAHSSLVELVVLDDVLLVIEAWEQAVKTGASHARVRLLTNPEHPVMVHFADVRHRHGVFLRFIVGEQAAEAGDGPVYTGIRPRLSLWRKDERAVIVAVDEAATRILGWGTEELVGHRSVEFIHPDDHQRAIANWMDMLGRPAVKQCVRLRHRHRDGSWVWFEVTNNNLISDPDQRCVVAEMIDISDEMDAHEALRANEQLLRRLTEALPQGVLQVAADRRILYRNDRLGVILGVGAAASVDEQFAGTTATDRPILEAALRAALEQGRDDDVRLSIQRLDGEVRACSVSIRPLIGESGVVTGAILSVLDITEDARLRYELEQRATFDELTHCHNRAATIHALEHALTHRRRRDGGVAVVFFDLDKFKEVNDRYGHATGDALLEHVAARLLDAARAGDLVGRLGGDEFLVMCQSVPTADAARHIAARFADALAGDITLGGVQITPRSSVGVAWSGGGEDADALVARADTAMYKCKTAGDGRPVLAPPTLHTVSAADAVQDPISRPRRSPATA